MRVRVLYSSAYVSSRNFYEDRNSSCEVLPLSHLLSCPTSSSYLHRDRSQSETNTFNGSPVNKRITSHVPYQSPAGSPLLGGTSNRHTTIVGPSSPIHSMLPQNIEIGNDAPPPPLPGRDSRRTLSNSMSNSSNTVSLLCNNFLCYYLPFVGTKC